MDLARILSNTLGEEPQIDLSILDSVTGQFVSGPYNRVEVTQDGFVILHQAPRKFESILEIVKELLSGLKGLRFLPRSIFRR